MGEETRGKTERVAEKEHMARETRDKEEQKKIREGFRH